MNSFGSIISDLVGSDSLSFLSRQNRPQMISNQQRVARRNSVFYLEGSRCDMLYGELLQYNDDIIGSMVSLCETY